ncbi:MAG: GlyGly-CTERM sorting domain-containing protein, partial [Rhizobiaceae bacterium]
EIAGRMDHILRTPKRLRPAVSNRSTGGTTPLFTLLLASLCSFRRHFDHINGS